MLGLGFQLSPAISGWVWWCVRFSGILAIPGWGPGCVCLDTGFGGAPAFLAGARGVCVCGFGFCLHSAFFWLGCPGAWPLACAASGSRHFLVGLPVAWGCAVDAVGGICPPPSPFVIFFGLLGGVWFWALSCRGFVVSAAACPSVGSLGLCPPFPCRLGCAHFTFARHFSSGVCADVSRVSLPPVGLLSRLGVAGFGRAVLRCSFGAPCGCRLWCCLAEGFARLLWSGCAALRLCVCLLPPPFLSFSFSRLCCLFVPPPPFFFWGGSCLLLPLPSLGWCTHCSSFVVANQVAVGACGWPSCALAP